MVRRIARMFRFGLFVLLAAASASATNGIRLDTLDVYRGLPANSVRAVLHDHDGFVWIGTQDGLARFDGERMEVWRHRRDDAASLGESHVISLAEDDAGRLFAAHPVAGISVFDPSRRVITHWRADTHGMVSDRVASLRRAGDGKLWVLFQSGEEQWLDLDNARAVSLPAMDPHGRPFARATADSAN